MKHAVVFRSEAQNEVADIAAYFVEQGSIDIANRWCRAIEETVNSLSEMPRRFPPAREADLFPGVELRQTLVMSHRIIFVIRDDAVHVLHVRHAARLNLNDL